jgi:hypothetical protein
LSFGRKPGKYNSFADLTLADGPAGLGVPLSLSSLSKEDIVMTLWPEDGRIIPGRIIGTDKRYLLELAESQDKGKRCFVLDEKCRSLLTASLSSDSSMHVRLLPPVAISSWMIATGAEPVLDARRSFVMEQDEDCFIITDMARGKKYVGFLTQQDAEDRKCEAGLIERMLMTVGIGAILPNYGLKRIGDSK